MVYVEQVEAGATRLVAVFASRHPGTVGPVRSVRNSDPELLASYGRPALAYSGGAGGAGRAGCAAPGCVDAGAPTRGGLYRRLGSRPRPVQPGRRPRRPGPHGPRGLPAGRRRLPVGPHRPAADPRPQGVPGQRPGRADPGDLPLGAAQPPLAAAQPRRLAPPHRLRPPDRDPERGRPVLPGPARPVERRRARHAVGLHLDRRHRPGAGLPGRAGAGRAPGCGGTRTTGWTTWTAGASRSRCSSGGAWVLLAAVGAPVDAR